MAKYTLVNEPNYILFNGIVGTPYENDAFAFRKSSVKQLRTVFEVDAISFVHLDDTDTPFRYYDLIDPSTGNPFVSLAICKAVILLWLNELGAVQDVFLGQWNATTNLPILSNGGFWDDGGGVVRAPARSYLIITTAGATMIDGENVWAVGDYIKSTGSAWVKIPEIDYIAAISVFFDATTIADPAWAAVQNVQEAIELLESSAVKNLPELLDVDSTMVPANDDVLTYDFANSRWITKAPGGSRNFIMAVAALDGTNVTLPAFGDGVYVLETGTTAAWVPVGAVVGDLLDRSGGSFLINKAMAAEVAGSYEVQYSAGKFINSNYVWNGTVWTAIDAYEPNPALLSLNVSNPMGDITAGLTGADLKSRSISNILDDILFETIYVAPIAPTLSLTAGTNLERGANIPSTLTPTFTQNGAGAAVDYSVLAVLDNALMATKTGVAPIPNVVVGNINGYDLNMSPVTNQLSEVVYTVNYAIGPMPADNKGVTHPGDQILAGSLQTTSTWTARYPIFYDVTNSAYGVSAGNLTDLSVTPTVNEADLRNLVNRPLFTGNSTLTDNIAAGDITILVALPPGITMSNSELNVAGSWLDFSDLRTHSIVVPVLAADSTTSRNYTVYYARSTAAGSFTIAQPFRFTTTGTVTA